MGDRTNPAPQAAGLTRSRLRKASDFLLENTLIGLERAHYEKYFRYIRLNSQNIFNTLVNLYSTLFLSQWHHFKPYMEQFPAPGDVHAWTYAARAYISCWFLDLYVSNRKAVMKLSPLAFQQSYYTEEIIFYSQEYDEYLTLLNATIHPTHIKRAMEDAIYIPFITASLDWATEDNPFVITSFTLDFNIFMGLIGIMKNTKGWNMSTLIADTLGRPAWLFDWHQGNKCCAWFPAEENYNMEDVSIAYIIGEACTPTLGPRDVDDWKISDQPLVDNPNLATLARVVPRRFYGSFAVRTLEVPLELADGDDPNVASRKRKVTKVMKSSTSAAASTGQEPAAQHRYRIIDWTYEYRVILNIEHHTRSDALRMIALT